MLGPQPHLANNAVLAHRPGKLRLDKAFTLIEGHQAGRLTYSLHLRMTGTSSLEDMGNDADKRRPG
jgi:hypothetical protein